MSAASSCMFIVRALKPGRRTQAPDVLRIAVDADARAVFNPARFCAVADMTVADFIPGCTCFKPDTQYAPLHARLGATDWDDATSGPKRTACMLTMGPTLVASKTVAAPTTWAPTDSRCS